MSAESAQSMANLTDVVTGSTSLESQLTRSGQSMSNLIDDVAAGSTNFTASVAGSKRTHKVRRRPNKHYRSKQRVFKAWADLIKEQPAPAAAPTAAPAASAAAEAPTTQRSMDEHRRLLAEAANVQGTWSKEKCKEIIQAAEALTELTPSENLTYIKALDEYDYPDWFRLLIE